MGPEDDPQVPRGPGPRLYAVLEGWTGFQCHHSQKQVRRKYISKYHALRCEAFDIRGFVNFSLQDASILETSHLPSIIYHLDVSLKV